MRDGITTQEQAVLASPRIITAYLARLDFRSETIFMWTGMGAIQPTGSGDSLLDGNIFHPFAEGVLTDIGENSFSYTGSDELTVTLGVPTSPNATIAAAQVYPNEYQGRQATLWRALLYPNSDPLGAPVWLFRRIRTGSMDRLEVQDNGTRHSLILTIESHQGLISNATNQTYLDQKKYDPTDTSQDYAASIANGDPAPSKAGVMPSLPGGGNRDGNNYREA